MNKTNINEYFSPSFRNSSSNFRVDTESYLLRKSMNKIEEFFVHQQSERAYQTSTHETNSPAMHLDQDELQIAFTTAEKSINRITTKILNQLRLMIKPDQRLVTSFRALVVLFQGTDTWLQADFRQCHWFKLLDLLKQPQKLLNQFRAFEKLVREELITETQVILASDLKGKSPTGRPTKNQINIVNDYCQIFDDAAKSIEEYVMIVQRVRLVKEGQQYQLMNEDSVQRLEIIQEQPSRMHDSSVYSQDQSQVFSQLNINTSFQIAQEINDESFTLGDLTNQVQKNTSHNKENQRKPKPKAAKTSNKASRSISENQPSQAGRHYQSTQEAKPDKSKSPTKRCMYSQQTSQAKIPTKPSPQQGSVAKSKFKVNDQDILLRRMETLTNDKLKLRNMIQEHRKIISQLQSQESQLMWKIEREAKELAKAKLKTREIDDIERYKVMSKQPIQQKTCPEKKPPSFKKNHYSITSETLPDMKDDKQLANLKWELTRSQLQIMEKQKNVETIKSLVERSKSHNQSYTN